MEPTRILLSADLRRLGRPSRISNVVYQSYVEAIEQAGGIPMILPVLSNQRNLPYYLDCADGLLLIGGRDYRTATKHSQCRHVIPKREQHDFALFDEALKRHMAILGICLGVQLIALGTGGAIYEDTVSQRSSALWHTTTDHEVLFDESARLRALFGERIAVNSSHHQSVRSVGKGMRIAGRAPDGVIEAVEGESDRFIVGVQWHPERMLNNEQQRILWHTFIAAAAGDGSWPSVCIGSRGERERD
jgi:putative glutamine amidotransferase